MMEKIGVSIQNTAVIDDNLFAFQGITVKDVDEHEVTSFYVAEKFACRISRVDLTAELVFGYHPANASCDYILRYITLTDQGLLIVSTERDLFLMDEDGYFKWLIACSITSCGPISKDLPFTPDGNFSSASVMKTTRLRHISNTSLYLIVDPHANAVRIMDLETEVIRTICFASAGNTPRFYFDDRNVPKCHVTNPRDVLLLDDRSTMYIGTHNILWKTTLSCK